jgi:nucleotide-binding universal stress UspA family protein
MSFKDVLIALTTYPEPTPVSAVDDAVDLAAALGAKVSAIACEVKIRAPGNVLGDYLLDIPALVADPGAPTVVLPHTRKRTGSFALDTVIVAWDFSRPATRAIADAMAILEKAKRVCVLTVTKEKAIDTRRSGAELAKHLARHSVDVVLDEVDAKGRGIGDVFKAHVTYRNADLLVMGAYGHSRIREFILGGATKRMLARPPVPIFLSH